MTKRTILVCMLIALGSLPAVSGHASPDPIDVEVHLIADDTDDSYALYDGFDLQGLYVREAYLRNSSEDGLMFRMIVYGGQAPASIAPEQTLRLQFQAGNASHEYEAKTSDNGASWSGSLRVYESQLEASDDGPGVSGSVQVFIPLTELGIGIGDSISDIVWESYAGDDLRDRAPGARPLPGTNGEVFVGEEGTVKQAEYTLKGAIDYTRTTLSRDPGNNYTVAVQNRITVIGQHISLVTPDQAGWTIERIEANAVAVEPAEHPTFTIRATSEPGAANYTLIVATDLGGKEMLILSPQSQTSGPGNETEPDGPSPEKDSPGVGWLAPLVALGLIVVIRHQTTRT